MDATVAHAICAAEDSVGAFCANTVLWGGLAGDARLVAAMRDATERVNHFCTAG